MPVLTSTGPPQIVDLAGRLVADLNSGRATRQTFGDRAVPFGWATGLPMTLARLVDSAAVDGLSFRAVRISRSGTPAGKVAEGAPKPQATTIASESVDLDTYAGIGTFTNQRAVDTDALVPSLASVIANDCLLAFDATCAAVLDADAGLSAGGATWPDAILAGIAAVSAAGGAASILVLSAADYAAAVQSPGVGYAMNPADGVPAMYGLRIVLMAGVAAGKGYVLDPAACLAVENAFSPAAIVDAVSQLDTNTSRVLVDFWAAFVVTSPGGVAEITVTPAGE